MPSPDQRRPVRCWVCVAPAQDLTLTADTICPRACGLPVGDLSLTLSYAPSRDLAWSFSSSSTMAMTWRRPWPSLPVNAWRLNETGGKATCYFSSQVGECVRKVSDRKQHVSEAEVVRCVLVKVHDEVGVRCVGCGVLVGGRESPGIGGKHLSCEMFDLRGISRILKQHQVRGIQWNGPMMGRPVKDILHQVDDGSVIMVWLTSEPFADNVCVSGL